MPIKEKENKPAFYVNGRGVPGSYYGLIVHKVCRGNRYEAAIIFARAHFEKVENVAGWIKAGLVKPKDGSVPYALRACKMEIENPQAFKDFIDKEILKINNTNTNRPMAQATRDALMDIVRGIKV